MRRRRRRAKCREAANGTRAVACVGMPPCSGVVPIPPGMLDSLRDAIRGIFRGGLERVQHLLDASSSRMLSTPSDMNVINYQQIGADVD